MTVIEHRYRPRGALADFFTLDSGEVVVSGPAGTGKSRAILERLLFSALRYEGMRGLIVRKTATSLTNTALVTWTQHVADVHIRHGLCHWYGGSAQEAAGYRFTNGSVINVGGMDKSDRIMSSEYDVAFIQECTELTLTDWEAISSRLRNGVMPFQAMWGDCNPSYPRHWVRGRAETDSAVMLFSTHRDNPRLYDDDGVLTEYGAAYMSRLDNLTGIRRKRLRDGLWVAAEGVVYDFDDAVHVVRPFDIPDDWPAYWSVDFGYTNPLVIQCWREDHDGRLFLTWEIYRTGLLVEDAAAEVARIVMNNPTRTLDTPWTGTWNQPQPSAIICDHDAEDRRTLERHLGLYTTAASKTVTTGIQEVETRLRPAGDGRPTLFVLDNATRGRDEKLADSGRPTSTQTEFPAYVWDTRDGRAPREIPVKEHDHGMDALRYVCMHRRHGRYAVGSFRVPGGPARRRTRGAAA